MVCWRVKWVISVRQMWTILVVVSSSFNSSENDRLYNQSAGKLNIQTGVNNTI